MIAEKRLRKFFRTRALAESFAEAQKLSYRDHGETALALAEDDRILFQAARDRLAAVGATIGKAVEFYLAHHKPLQAALTLEQMLARSALEKELAGKRPHYLSQYRCSCNSFLRGRETMPAADVTREDVKAWVLGNDWAPKTQRVYLGDLRSMFAWGVQERFLAVNPIAGTEGFIQLATSESAEIAVLDVEQCAALLRAALFAPGGGEGGFRELIGYLAVAMFAGVRPHEIKRTAAERIDTRERTVVVAARSAKTRQRRVIEMERVGVVWLRLWKRLCPGCLLVPKNFDRRWKALRKAAGLGKWPHDVLRHTFASYHYASQGNLARLQSQMGHSEDEDTLFRHYRGVATISGKTVSRRMADQFWSLTPRRVRLS